MRRLVRIGLSIVGLIAVTGVVLSVAGGLRRFQERQFPEGEVRPVGWLARFYGWASPWMNEWLYALFARRLDLKAEDEVLDVACGSGAFLRKHAAHARRVAGLDHSEDLIDIALRENCERVAAGTAEFVVGDATVLPWGDDQFSVVTCNCIDCFAPKSKAALAEMYRVLRPGGRALVADDHREEMESVGFVRASVERILWGDLTTAYKE